MFDPLASMPLRDCREWRTTRCCLASCRPVQCDAWWRIVPVNAAIREQRPPLAYGFSDSDVAVVFRYRELASAHPDLSQARIDVDQGSASECLQNIRRDFV